MTKTFINYSNHPSDKWSDKMLDAARQFGEIIDMPFAPVDPSVDKEQIIALAEGIVGSIVKQYPNNNDTVLMVQGEMTLTYHLVYLLKDKGYTCLASTSERLCTTDSEGNRVTRFEFGRFREY